LGLLGCRIIEDPISHRVMRQEQLKLLIKRSVKLQQLSVRDIKQPLSVRLW